MYYCAVSCPLCNFSVRVCIDWMVGEFDESMSDLVRLSIGFWSPLELIVTCLIVGIVSTCCCITPLEVMAVYFYWPPLEVDVGYLTGTTACLGMSDNTVGY